MEDRGRLGLSSVRDRSGRDSLRLGHLGNGLVDGRSGSHGGSTSAVYGGWSHVRL